MSFGKKAAFDATATETVSQAYERSRDPIARAAWARTLEWTGDVIATSAIRETVANLIRANGKESIQ